VTRLVVDGNDGTGKSTKMADDPSVEPNPAEFYVILDAPVEVCRERLLAAGKNVSEQYHMVEDLTFYRQRFLEVAETLHNRIVIDASGSPRAVVETCLAALRERELVGRIVMRDSRER
jgi:thymidylate kinase